jgi:hypothetical protein
VKLSRQAAKRVRRDSYAQWWAITLVILGTAGISSAWIRLGSFWNGYILDMTGPAWNYILFRRLFTVKTENAWSRFFTPVKTLLIFLVVCSGIEMAQFFGLYEATFDPWDFLAYVSLLLPVFIVDIISIRNE